MSPADIAARALTVDAASIVSVESIEEGLTNRSWLVRTASDAVVVRISNPNWQSLQIDRYGEARILATVARAGIGPDVLRCDAAGGVLVTRYMGPTCSLESIRDPNRIARLGRLLRSLHSLPAPSGVEEVHWPSVIAGYVDTLGTLSKKSAEHDEELRSRAEVLAREIDATAANCLCHNDVHFMNVIDGGELRLIDWEYAGIGEPYYDLASVCVYNDFTMTERAALLSAYSGTVDASGVERLAKCCFVFEQVHELWLAVRASVGAAG